MATRDGVAPRRFAHLRRTWPRYAWESSGRTRWDAWDAGRTSFTLGTAAFCAAVYLEIALWFSGADPFLGVAERSARGWAAVALLVALNGWILDRSLARRSRGEPSFPAWLRAVRAAVVALPLLGLAAIPIWRRLLERRPRWALRAEETALDLRSAPIFPGSGLCRALESRRRRAAQSFWWQSLWVVLCQVGPILMLISWLGARGGWGEGRRTAVLATCVALHLAAGAGAAVQTVSESRRLQLAGWRALAYRATPFLLLLPFPAAALGLLNGLTLAGESWEEKTLVHAAFERRGGDLRPLAWGRVPNSLAVLARWFGRRRGETPLLLSGCSPELGGREERCRSLYRLKTFLLVFDAGALGWWLSRLHGRPILSMASPPSAFAPFLIAAALGLSANGLGLLSRLARLGRWSEIWERHPYGRYLALTQLAFALGLLLGSLAAAGQASWMGLVLTAAGFSGIFATFISAVLAGALRMAGRSPVLSAAWILFYFEWVVAGVLLQANAETGQAVLRLFERALALAPVWSFALGLALGPSLWRSPDRPGPGRTLRALLAASAFLPLGGLAVPLWIYVRHTGTRTAGSPRSPTRV